jgi:tetratricopeptide (TPR) repeat protein
MVQVVNLECPGCGAPVSTEQKVCIYCKRPIVIASFNTMQSMSPPELNKYANAYRKELVNNPDNQELNTSIALCYLKLKLYDKALPAFEKAMEENFDNAETFVYAAVCLLKGKKAFLASRADIDKAVEYINAALMIDPKGIYYYFLAYIKYDYFERKYLNISPKWQDDLMTALESEVSDEEMTELFEVLQVEMPECLDKRE